MAVEATEGRDVEAITLGRVCAAETEGEGVETVAAVVVAVAVVVSGAVDVDEDKACG